MKLNALGVKPMIAFFIAFCYSLGHVAVICLTKRPSKTSTHDGSVSRGSMSLNTGRLGAPAVEKAADHALSRVGMGVGETRMHMYVSAHCKGAGPDPCIQAASR